jgi:transposase InsO family protein
MIDEPPMMMFDVFEQDPAAAQILSAIKCICNNHHIKPKYLISDRGTQFTSSEFRQWCTENNIKQRFGAVGKRGSIAVTERVILTYKEGCTRQIIVPISKEETIFETKLFFDWYNEHRPHMTLSGNSKY